MSFLGPRNTHLIFAVKSLAWLWTLVLLFASFSMEEGNESILEAIYEEEGQTLEEGELEAELEDAEMLDAEEETEDGGEHNEQISPGDSMKDPHGATTTVGNSRRRRAKKKKRNNKKKNAEQVSNIADINRFVVDTCRHLKERKNYLIWNAVGVLGASAVRDLVKEVDAIQCIGGQLTVDGKRFRTSGGILWNILKTREPKAYKEIMTRGKEFEKQFRPQNFQHRVKGKSEDAHASDGLAGQVLTSSQPSLEPKVELDGAHVSALKRIRAPVSYDDLFGHCTTEQQI
ncbi:hypothetical protein ACLOJK_039808 [Asimina triloba]